LFLADRSNSGIDVITLQGELFVRTIGGFVGLRGPADSGPNDLALVPELNQLWVTDGDSSVKVIDLATRSIVATVPTGGRGRADDIAYDARDKLIAVGNDSDAPPFLTFISVADRKTIGTLEFPGAGGLEAVLWTADGTKTGAPTPALGIIDAASNRWLQNVSTFAGAHSVVGDPATNHVYVPLPAQGFTVLGGGSAVLNVDR